LWRLRLQLRWVRRGLVVAIIGMACVMKAPVWYAIARVSDLTGGTGWHRSYLIDQAVEHFNEWWLTGSTYTAHWAPSGQVLAVDPDNMDITNHYIMEGLGGGICKLGLFLGLIVLGFKTVGRYIRRPNTCWPGQELFVWSMGVCLLGHCVSFISIVYFDQIIVMWFWLLACLAMLAAHLQAAFQNFENTQLAEEPREAFMETSVPS
jgi:hypothetical protein